MSENKHTPEPWSIDPDDRPNMHWNNHIVSDENPNIAICFMAHDGTEQNECGEANARRIVACVNACAGIPTGALEDMVTPIRQHLNSADIHAAKLVKQRDELLAALEKLTDVFANIGITSGLYDDEQDALKSACAAIASVKGKQ